MRRFTEGCRCWCAYATRQAFCPRHPDEHLSANVRGASWQSRAVASQIRCHSTASHTPATSSLSATNSLAACCANLSLPVLLAANAEALSSIHIVTSLGRSTALFRDGDDLLGRAPAAETSELHDVTARRAAEDLELPDSLKAHLTTSSPSRTVNNEDASLFQRPLKGVFLTRAVKKFTPIHVLPEALAVAHDLLRQRQKNLSSEAKANPFDAIAKGIVSEVSSTTFPTDVQWTAAEWKALRRVRLAAPYLSNRVREPIQTISLSRFLAARHCWYSGAYFHISTLNGWYLLAPSWSGEGRGASDGALVGAASQCPTEQYPECSERIETNRDFSCLPADVAGATEWCRRIHPRYDLQKLQERDQEGTVGSIQPSNASLLEGYRHLKAEELKANSSLAEWDAPPHRHSGAGELGDEDRAEEVRNDDDDDEEATYGELEQSRKVQRKPKKSKTKRRRIKVAGDDVLYISESHLFELNDAIQWPSPPLEAFKVLCGYGNDAAKDEASEQTQLASMANLFQFFAKHLDRIRAYDESGGGWTMEEEEEFVLEAMEAWCSGQQALQSTRPSKDRTETMDHTSVSNPSETKEDFWCADVPSEVEVLGLCHRLFCVYTQKANAQLTVDEESQLLTLTPLQNLPPGTELVLHYGREWWTEHFLYPLLLLRDWCAQAHRRAAAGMERVRSVDTLKALTDCVQRIERLVAIPTDEFEAFPALQAKPKRKRAGTKKGRAGQKEESAYFLYNKSTQGRASNAAVWAAAVQRSLLSPAFFMRLVQGAPGSAPPVFDVWQPDQEVPWKALRRALLEDLCSDTTEREKSSTTGEMLAEHLDGLKKHLMQRWVDGISTTVVARENQPFVSVLEHVLRTTPRTTPEVRPLPLSTMVTVEEGKKVLSVDPDSDVGVDEVEYPSRIFRVSNVTGQPLQAEEQDLFSF